MSLLDKMLDECIAQSEAVDKAKILYDQANQLYRAYIQNVSDSIGVAPGEVHRAVKVRTQGKLRGLV